MTALPKSKSISTCKRTKTLEIRIKAAVNISYIKHLINSYFTIAYLFLEILCHFILIIHRFFPGKWGFEGLRGSAPDGVSMASEILISVLKVKKVLRKAIIIILMRE